jgi:3-keto-5-aminohexanoate cleavage enzyme
VFEPGWMKTVVAMAKAGTLPRGSKLNIYFGPDNFSAMAPLIPEALELYLKMMEGLDLKWSVGTIGNDSIMDSPLARMALERGGSFRVGLEDWATGPSNVEQIERAKEIVNAVGRRVVTGAEAIEYLDIPYAPTRPKA